MSVGYITIIPIDSDMPGAPDAWFDLIVFGRKVLAGETPTGRPVHFTSLNDAMMAAHDILIESPEDVVTWTPQYDSAFTEALQEPIGYVGELGYET